MKQGEKKGSQNQLPTTSTSNSRGTVIVVSMTREKCLIPVPHTNVHTSCDNQDQSSNEIDKDLPSPLGMSIQVPGTTRKEQDGSNQNQTSSVHRRLTAAPHEQDVVSVNIEFHSKTNHDMTLPQFCNHFFRLHYKRFFHHIDGMSDDPTNEISTTLELFGSTELKFEDPRIGNIRAHPNYQSEGPWRDWVMAKVPKKKGNLLTRYTTNLSENLIPSYVKRYASFKYPLLEQTPYKYNHHRYVNLQLHPR